MLSAITLLARRLDIQLDEKPFQQLEGHYLATGFQTGIVLIEKFNFFFSGRYFAALQPAL